MPHPRRPCPPQPAGDTRDPPTNGRSRDDAHAQQQHQHQQAEQQHAREQQEDSHLYRLFVGWVPKHFSEEDLEPIFQQCGYVQDILILRDQVTGQHRGCAFVSYATQDEAEFAIESLDRKLQLPGALSLLEVRFARSHHFVQAGSGPEDNRQLFFAKAPVTACEEEIRQLFIEFGEVSAWARVRRRARAPPGSERLASGAAAGVRRRPGGRRCRWSGGDGPLRLHRRRKRPASRVQGSEHACWLLQVEEVNLFRERRTLLSKGCGFVTMATREQALAAMEALNDSHVMEVRRAAAAPRRRQRCCWWWCDYAGSKRACSHPGRSPAARPAGCPRACAAGPGRPPPR